METKMDRVKRVFDESGLSQTQIAKKLDVTPQYIWKMLNSDSEPSERMLLAIEKGFKYIRGEWLRTGEGSMTYEPSREEKIAEISAKIFMRNDLDPEDEETLLQLINAAVDLTPEQIRSVIEVAQTIAKKFGLPD